MSSNQDQRAEYELAIKALLDQGDVSTAVSRIIGEGYGAEVLSYLIGHIRDEAQATAIYSDFCLSLLETIETFRWECSLRTWVFAKARYAKLDYYRSAKRGIYRQPHVPLTNTPGLAEVVERTRTRTLAHFRTTNKDHLVRIREQLNPLDREVLVLHVDRKMTFPEIARILWEEDGEISAEEVRRGANRLKQRFHQTKRKLRELMIEEGLLAPEQ